MQQKDNLTSILLLIVIGLAIYVLLNNCNGFRNVKDVEPFDANLVSPFNLASQDISNMNMNTIQQLPQQYIPPLNNDEVNNNVEYQNIDYGNTPTMTSMVSNNILDFQPNDEAVHEYNGAMLGDAFALPIPPGTNTDTLDFKKSNMDNYNAADFLPKEINDQWFETDFSLAKYQLNDDKLINTDKYIIGVNTVGESLKNASYDIRGTIPNPKFIVSPWNNSTYEPDFNLKPLC